MSGLATDSGDQRSLVARFAGDGVWVLLGKGATGIAQFASAAVVARLFADDRAQADAFFLTAAAVILLLPVVSLGYPRMIVRFVAQDASRFGFLIRFCSRRLAVTAAVLLVTFLVGRQMAPDLVGGFIDDAIGPFVAIAALVVFGLCFLWIEAVRALGRVSFAALSLASVRVGFLVVLVALLLLNLEPPVRLVFMLYGAVPLVVGLVVVAYAWSVAPGGVRSRSREVGVVPPSGFAAAARVTWLTQWLFVLGAEAGYFILGALGDPGEVTVFAGAMRMALLVQLPLTVLIGVAPRLIAQHFQHGGDNDALQDSLQLFSAAAAVPMLGAVALLALVGDWLLGLIFGGDDFREAGIAVLIVCGAQAVNALFGPSQSTLAMTGQERLALMSTAAGTLVAIVVAVAAVPSTGVTGAALGYAAGVVTVNLWNYRLLKQSVDMLVHANPALLLREVRRKLA